MQIVYFIAQMGITAGLVDRLTETSANLLNETLRPHLEHPEDQQGDIVHADLEEAKRLAKDIVIDLGDKGIDVLAIAVDDEVFESLKAAGDIRESLRKDPYGGRLLKLSRNACHVINGCCTVMPLRYTVPSNLAAGGWGNLQ